MSLAKLPISESVDVLFQIFDKTWLKNHAIPSSYGYNKNQIFFSPKSKCCHSIWITYSSISKIELRTFSMVKKEYDIKLASATISELRVTVESLINGLSDY